MVRAVVTGVLVVLFLLPVGAASAAPAGTVPYARQTTAPPGPAIDTPPTEQDSNDTRQRLVIGIVAVVLLGVVILGHRTRAKRKKKT